MENNDFKKNIICITIVNIIFNIALMIFFFILFLLHRLDINLFLNIFFGLIVGLIIGSLMIIHMSKTLNEFIYFKNENQAISFLRKRSIFRYLIFVVFSLILSFIKPYVGLMTVVSVFGIKIGAYLTPIIKNRIFC